MGQPADDVSRLREVLGLLQQSGMHAQRVRCGDLEVDGLVLLSPPGDEGVDMSGLTDLSPEEQAALRSKEDERLTYGASS